jgi:predicted dehydrogenase
LSRLTTVLIGFGKVADTLRYDVRMARYFPDASHAQVLARHDQFEFAAVVDPSEEARDRAQRDWGVKTVAASVADLPARERYTAAVIASPPAGRLAVIEALPSLRAVLVEKPLGRSLREALAFVEACGAHKIAVQVNYWRRAVPTFRDLAAGGLAQVVGNVQAVFGLYGNGLLNNGSHLVDFLRMLCGEVKSIEGCGPARPATSSVRNDRNIACLLRLANDASVALAPVDFGAWREIGLDIWGRSGRVSIMQESLAVTRYPVADNRGLDHEREINSGSGEATAVDVSMSLSAMYDNLSAAAGTSEPLLSPLADALKSEILVQDILARAAVVD